MSAVACRGVGLRATMRPCDHALTARPVAVLRSLRRPAPCRRNVRVTATAAVTTPWERLQGAQVLRGIDGAPVELTGEWYGPATLSEPCGKTVAGMQGGS